MTERIPARSSALATLTSAVAVALVASGCYGFTTHERAPRTANTEALATFLHERTPAPARVVPRPIRVRARYEKGPINSMDTGERAAADLVPFWPYARGQWPEVPAEHVAAALERALARSFQGTGEPYWLELRFGDTSYVRLTRTAYGLSVFNVLGLVGAPTEFYTVRMAGAAALYERAPPEPSAGAGDAASSPDPTSGPPSLADSTFEVEHTALSGLMLLLFPYNSRSPSWPPWGRRLRDQDIFGTAILELYQQLEPALVDAALAD